LAQRNPDSLSIGVDIGGTKVLGGVVDLNGNIVERSRRDTPKNGGNDLTKAIADVILELHGKYPANSIGISAATLVSTDRQTLIGAPNIADWDGINLRNELFALTKLECVVENDANSAAWGEAVHGAAKGFDQVVVLTVGTGIGGGFIANGSLYRGAHGVAAEFGHIRVVNDGLKCGCGSHGCLEQYASGTALMRHTREEISKDKNRASKILSFGDGTLNGLRGEHITSAAKDGDSLAIEMLALTGYWIGVGVASLCAALDPEVVVIGGGVIDAGDLLLEPARKSLKANILFSNNHKIPDLVAAKLGNDAGLVGVADLARR
jgi:glucokinase